MVLSPVLTVTLGMIGRPGARGLVSAAQLVPAKTELLMMPFSICVTS